MNVGFIGFGKMGQALVAGALKANVIKPRHVLVYDHNPKARTAAKRLKLNVIQTGQMVVNQSDFVFLCVKPQSLATALMEFHASRACFVSIAAGTPIAKLKMWLGEDRAIIRVMSNTPALVQAGASAMSCGKNVSLRQRAFVQKFLGAVGNVVELPEKAMDAVTAVSGSGPAYVFYLAEAMIKAAKAAGLQNGLAQQLVRQTIYGAGRMLTERYEPVDQLRRHVTSPGGTTAAAVDEFDRRDLKKNIVAGILKAVKRAKEISKQ